MKELRYSESAAGRRIQAMRLLKEIPEVAPRIESGTLSLSNVCRAQGLFRDLRRSRPEVEVGKEEKRQILAQLDGKSAREGERILLSLAPPQLLPPERERAVSAEHVEVRLVLSRQIKAQLEEVRALLGQKGVGLNLAELISEMARLSTERLTERRFGKARARQAAQATPDVGSEIQLETGAADGVADRDLLPTALVPSRQRYISRAVRYEVWRAAGGKCVACGGQHNLQFDHVQPVALGGASTGDNLQLLCQACNVRRGVKTYGARAMRRHSQ